MGRKADIRARNAQKRKIELENQRRERELLKKQKELEKAQELENNLSEIEKYENYLGSILSLHKEDVEKIYWEDMINAPFPVEPTKSSKYKLEATKIKESYRASLFDKLFNRVEKKLEKLYNNIDIAEEKDTNDYHEALEIWRLECVEWEKKRKCAEMFLSGDRDAKKEIFEKCNKLNEVKFLGSNFVFYDENEISSIEFLLNDESIIPVEHKKILKNGSLSVKEISKKNINDIYREYVCSAIFRVAKELFSILPDEKIYIHGYKERLNTSNGHVEDVCIISVLMDRDVIESFDMNGINPSDALKNFNCNVLFKGTTGFGVVEKVNI